MVYSDCKKVNSSSMRQCVNVSMIYQWCHQPVAFGGGVAVRFLLASIHEHPSFYTVAMKSVWGAHFFVGVLGSVNHISLIQLPSSGVALEIASENVLFIDTMHYVLPAFLAELFASWSNTRILSNSTVTTVIQHTAHWFLNLRWPEAPEKQWWEIGWNGVKITSATMPSNWLLLFCCPYCLYCPCILATVRCEPQNTMKERNY